ncbi:hypothetical protein [Sphingomonas montana]|uniref:hypothetical protein n=1 Tax=Sphingomonas montana TaxID=1843236 RepID=UPI00096E77B6|nr:hypothetical protein [Sphingomonas montana]
MRKFMLVCGAVMTLATSPAVAGPNETVAERGRAELATALKGLVPGKPVRCLPFASVQSTQVIPGVGLLYDVGGGRRYLNRPQGGLASLRRDAIPVTSVTGGSICRIESVQLLDRVTRMPAGFVILGDFVPYSRPDRMR